MKVATSDPRDLARRFLFCWQRLENCDKIRLFDSVRALVPYDPR